MNAECIAFPRPTWVVLCGTTVTPFRRGAVSARTAAAIRITLEKPALGFASIETFPQPCRAVPSHNVALLACSNDNDVA